MDDATRAMNALILSELPDPGQDLSFQQLHAFPFFAKLPLEIRRIIFHTPTMPVGLRINHESRVETFRHYDIFFLPGNIANRVFVNIPTPFPICSFNWEVDTLVLEESSLTFVGASLAFCVLESNTEKFSEVRGVEIRPRTAVSCGKSFGYDFVIVAALRLLPKLEIVSFICPSGTDFPRVDAPSDSTSSHLVTTYTGIIKTFGLGYGCYGLTPPEMLVKDALGNQMQKSLTEY
ncbi:hypothetical protein DL98DRAFT_592867 [Cadophora sp. DSE1049]|nr:hypothetical protein DL98DRAFT_592867 [Cadophora sp. DSE1049]